MSNQFLNRSKNSRIEDYEQRSQNVLYISTRRSNCVEETLSLLTFEISPIKSTRREQTVNTSIDENSYSFDRIETQKLAVHQESTLASRFYRVSRIIRRDSRTRRNYLHFLIHIIHSFPQTRGMISSLFAYSARVFHIYFTYSRQSPRYTGCAEGRESTLEYRLLE